MQKQKLSEIQNEMCKLFDAMNNLESLIDKEAMNWARNNWDDNPDAESIISFGQNLIDIGRTFNRI